MVAGYDLTSFKVFVCYHEKKSPEKNNSFAGIINDILEAVRLRAFVAHIERNSYSEVFDDVRNEIISNASYFIFINTQGALVRPEIVKEFIMAYPHGLSNNPKLIVLRHDSAEVGDPDFESKTGIKLEQINQPTFQDEVELVNVMRKIIVRYDIKSDVQPENIPSEEQLQKETRLKNYLRYCTSLTVRTNDLDKKTLSDLYIRNDAVLLDIKNWNTRDEELPEGEVWSVEDFLKSSQRKIYLSASYGIGKTSWSYKLVADLARTNLKTMFSDYFPIHIPLRHGLDRVNDDGDSLDLILSQLKNDTRILFVFDALDEFDKTGIPHILESISGYLTKYPNSKTIITTRPNSNFQQILKIDKYARLRLFTKQQVNEFYRKYGLDLDYDTVSKSGLESDEICKPLFCWMISLVYARDKSILLSSEITLNRILLFFRVIHDVLLGKHITDATSYDYDKHELNEKRVLRKIAELKHVYSDDLTEDKLEKLLRQSQESINPKILEVYDKLISTYFYSSRGSDYDVHLDFIHRSFEEYLLAEYYIECFLRKEVYRINLKVPSEVTIQFFDGLLQLLNTGEDSLTEYVERLAKSYRQNLGPKSLKIKLLVNARESFADKNIYRNNRREYPNVIESYENLALNRWASIAVLNRLGNFQKLDTKMFFKLLKATHASIPDHLIRIDNVDLSGHEFDGDTPNYNLSNAKLRNSKFHGTFYGTKFSGADLSDSLIETGATFTDCDFSGANMSRVRVDDETVYSASFISCDFRNCNLSDSRIARSNLTGSDFSNANFRGADFGSSNFSLTYLTDVQIDGKTSMKYIELIGNQEQWRELVANKDLIKYLLSKMNTDLKDRILRDNPDWISTNSE